MERKWAHTLTHTHTHTHAMELSRGAEQFVVFPSRFSFTVPGPVRPPAAGRCSGSMLACSLPELPHCCTWEQEEQEQEEDRWHGLSGFRVSHLTVGECN